MIDLEKEMTSFAFGEHYEEEDINLKVMYVHDAILVAKRAIEDACKEQRKICNANIKTTCTRNGWNNAINRVRASCVNTPLATEE